MPNFSIRHLLLLTFCLAIGLSISKYFGADYFVWHNLLFLHIALICVSAVSAFEYTGYRRRHFIGTFFVLGGFLIWMSLELHSVADHIVCSLLAFIAAYLVGLIAAATYRAINNAPSDDGAGLLLNIATRVLAKFLAKNCRDTEDD